MPFPSSSGSGTTLKSSTISQINHLFNVGDWIYYNGTAWALADADAYASSQAIGVIEAGGVIDADNFIVTYDGLIDLTGASYAPLTPGSNYYLDTTAGVATETAISGIYKALFTATSTTGGYIIQGQGQTAVVQSGTVTTITSGQSTTSSTFVDVTGGSFTLPTAGTYKITYVMTADMSNDLANVRFRLADNSGTEVPGSSTGSTQSNAGIDAPMNIVGEAIVTISDPATYKMQWCRTNGGTATLRNSGNATSTVRWVQIGAAPVPMSLAGEYGYINIPNQTSTSATLEDVTGGTFTLTPGTWELIYTVTTDHSTGANTTVQLAFTDSLNNIVAGSERTRAGGVTSAQELSAAVIVTVGTTENYKLRKSDGGSGTLTIFSSASQGSTITYQKISGFIPSSGQTVDYVKVNLTATTSALGINIAIPFDSIESGNIPYNTSTGRFTLTAGKTYRLVSNVAGATSNQVSNFQWYNVTAGALIGNMGENDPTNVTSVTYGATQAEAVITPSVNTVIELRNVLLASRAYRGGTSGTGPASSASIVQLGSSNVITSTPSYVQIERHSASVTVNDYTISTASSNNYYTVAPSGQRVSFTSANGTVVGGDFTIGTNQITINTAGTYDIRGLIAGEPTANSAVWAQLVLDGTTVLNASVQYAGGATFNSNVTTQYIGSFSAGATIDMRVGNPTGTTMGMHTTSLIIRRVIN